MSDLYTPAQVDELERRCREEPNVYLLAGAEGTARLIRNLRAVEEERERLRAEIEEAHRELDLLEQKIRRVMGS